jgi:hypothetical protein
MEIQEIYENAKKDPSLFSSINMEELLDKIENETTEYLENKTLSELSKIVFTALSEYNFEKKTLDKETIQQYCDKLTGYRYVDKICDLRQGVYIRWIKNGVLKNGGIVINIKFGNNVQIICKTAFHQFVSLNFHECIIFQKLTMEEQLILMSYEYLEKMEEK